MSRLLWLLLLLLCASGAAFYVYWQQPALQIQQQSLFADLAGQVQHVNRLQLDNQSGNVLTATLQNDQWHTELAGRSYPLDQSKVVQLLNQLAQGQLLEQKTRNPENYARLGVQDVSLPDSQAVLVTLYSPVGQWQLLVGLQAKQSTGSYVRLPNQPHSWLFEHDLALPVTSNEWLQRPILPFSLEQVQRLSRVDGADDERWHINRHSEGGWSLSPQADEQQALRYPGILQHQVDDLLQLGFEQVLPLESDQQVTTDTVAEFVIELVSGQQVTALLQREKQDYFMRFASESNPGYWQAWLYQISRFSAQQLDKQLSDFYSLVDPQPASALSNAQDEGESPQE